MLTLSQSHLERFRRDANAPTCKRKNCDCKMVIRQGNGAYFWGCSAFPKCWNKQWLKKEELELLPD